MAEKEERFVKRMISMTASQSVTLYNLSRETGTPQSVIIRQALDRYLAEREKERLELEAARRAAGR